MEHLLHLLKDILLNSFLITSLVLIMMIMIEYINVASAGRYIEKIRGSSLKQVLFGSLLGLIPGCIGGFAAVSLFSHGILGLGGLIAAMISSSGDESFLMLAMIPSQALLLFAILFFLGIVCGLITELIFKKHPVRVSCDPGFEIHEDHAGSAGSFPKIFRLSSYAGLKKAGWQRLCIIAMILLFVAGVFSGILDHEHGHEHGHEEAGFAINFLSERWMNIIFACLSLFVAMLVAASSEHFVKDHLWHHVIGKHALKTFLWTAGALTLITLGLEHVDIAAWVKDNSYYLLILAALVGMIPESGPHMIFISLFAGGMAPFSVLLTSSMSQDGHTSLPLLASSTRSFFIAKLLNALFAIAIGSVFYLFGL